jgi:hypothetical protein
VLFPHWQLEGGERKFYIIDRRLAGTGGLGMKKILILIIAFFGLLISAGYGQEFRESEKIQYLISSIETLNGAQFIRNGKAYDARKAADHLRFKLNVAGNLVKTAEDFIRLCASKSSVSGEPYRIRYSDGVIIESEVFFHNRLKAFPEKTIL